MNLLKLSFLLILMTFLASCSDDDPVCLQSDWVGTYTGSQTCTGDTAIDQIVTITGSGTSDIIIIYEDADGFSSEFDPLTTSGCDLEESGTQGDLTLSFEASLDGDKLTLIEVFTQGAVSNTCTLTATRN